ncbi:aldehyde ferredoxin oxidoreductase C-terminal domain-containing protein [Syntrophotalea acetylenica]|uniref:Aldehyde ferredoxin oxidoreductase n=1 Tax=Syntrophotalea acetylenica TaxID=29542 RepID=A0A1L3GDP2_SYNAC|nr:aldehyde ferredoxin oxidoreductase C-terminal domain-containing protein [Syntrophotalea acetylenica]APG23939.1 aldehyde ferredoxin oxidoreductase [Syntrophotalea acetylenica]APG44520.1 aldehyde ferredoxin oxidoreductase [Syntrophotalea acetylenica]
MGDKIIRVNMSSLTTAIEPVPEHWQGLGGRALTSVIVTEEVPPQCDPLGKNNKLVFAPGLLTGTAVVNSGRLSAGFKSPLTGGIKESNAGGSAGQKLVKLGIKALIIEGLPLKDTWYNVHIQKDGAVITEDTEYVGKGNYELFKAIGEKRSSQWGVLAIGPAGEFRMTSANISVKDPDGNIRSHGRGGGGAVMGTKRIKYITIDDAGGPGVTLADPEKFKQQARMFAKGLLDHPITGHGLPTMGTNAMANIVNEAGAFPTKNFRYGQWEEVDKICGETMQEVIVSRSGNPSHGCQKGCIIKCSQIYTDPKGEYVTSGFEYETIQLLGANALLKDLDIIAKCDWVMDDIGIDSIEGSVAISTAMEAGILDWGDGEETYRLLEEEVRIGTPLGRILGNGAGSVGKAYGITRVPTVKNQAIPAYDPRTIRGFGITYAVSTMGADHTAGYAIATNILKIGGFVEPLEDDGQVELSRNLQIATAALDSTGLCLMVAFPVLDVPECFTAIYELINARYGLSLTAEDVTALGKMVLKAEHAFNQKAGLTNAHDRLPEFFDEPLPPHNIGWNYPGDKIDEFWNF